MASTYSNLKIQLMATGENSGTWGTVTNTNLGTAIEEAIVGRATANFTSDANLTLSLTNTNATQTARNLVLNVTSSVSLTTTRDLIVPGINKLYIIQNNTTGSQSIRVIVAGGSVTVPSGKTAIVYNDGTNVSAAFDFLPLLNVDNINIDVNTISSTNTNGNIVLAPNGTGDVQVDADTLRVGDSNVNATITTNGTGDLILNTNAGTNSGSITIQDAANGNIIFAPNGTGRIQVSGTTAAPAILELYEDADNGTNYIALSAPSSVASNVTFTLPNADGTSGQVLQTNGSGVLSFATSSGISTGKSIAMAMIFGF